MRYQSWSRRPSELERRPTDLDFWITTEHEGSGYILGLFGELDVASAPVFEKKVKRLQWAGATAIVIDLSGLDFIDSSGLHVLLRAHRRSLDGQMTLLRGPNRVHRVFELTRTDEILPFAD